LSGIYAKLISNEDLLNKNFTGFATVSHQLYQLIFGKISLPPGRIIISPDGQYFPFESLMTNLQTHSYFLQDYAISYTYSARFLLNDFLNNSSSTAHTFMGIAPLQYSNGLATLTGSDQSLQRMQSYFRNTKSLVGRNASRNN